MPVYASYDTALAHYTFIADSSLSSFAVDRKVFSEYQKKMEAFLHPEEGNIRLEIWKYDPTPLAGGNYVDKLSLMLCYLDTDDERVRKEINEMINKIVW